MLGTECVIPKDVFKEGELVLWFPPNLLIPEEVAMTLGVAGYLKHGDYPGETEKSKCRVAACRLRGVPSYGFVVSLALAANATRPEPADSETERFHLDDLKPGDNVDECFGAVKYTPPAERVGGLPRPQGFNGDAAPDHPNFHRYTDIQNFYKYGQAFEDGTPVRVTEKLHGSNVRLGLIKIGETEEGECSFEFMCGSNKVNWKQEDSKGNTPLWWRLLTEEVMQMLTHLCDEKHSVIVFGEVYGPGVQDMDYGADADLGFRVFDISVDGRYLNWGKVERQCHLFKVKTVPLLYIGPFSKVVVTDHTNGPTAVCPPEQIKAKFKGREGIVITPLEETFSEWFRGRLILKSVSADYHDRKGALDLA